jgi:aquaporin Z
MRPVFAGTRPATRCVGTPNQSGRAGRLRLEAPILEPGHPEIPPSGKECALFPKLAAESLGTFWLVLGGCGSAVLAAAFPDVGIGLLGVSLAFGLTVLSGAYALGPISGGHFNPAVSVGLWAGGRFPAAQLLPYILAQVLGGVVGAGVLYFIASGRADFSLAGGFASNGYGVHSPGGYSLAAALVCEVVMTFMFLIVILGTTHKRAPSGFAGLAIGLALTLIHLIQHSGDQHVGQSGAQHRDRAVRRRLGSPATLAVLAPQSQASYTSRFWRAPRNHR